MATNVINLPTKRDNVMDLLSEAIICKIMENRKAIDMITNHSARNSLQYEIHFLNDILRNLDNYIIKDIPND